MKIELGLPLPSKKWLKTNWKWLLPTIVIFASVVFFGGRQLLISSFVYQESLKVSQEHDVTIKHIGKPLKTGFWVMGQVNWNVTEGNGNIQIPVSGPNGEGFIHGEAIKHKNKWELTKLNLILVSGEKLTLSLK